MNNPPTNPAPGGQQISVVFHPLIRKPWVTYSILGLTGLVFLAQMASQTLLAGTDLPFLYGGKINELIHAGQFWRLITPVLLHASIIHIAFNMYALFAIGAGMESYYGHGRFLLLYLVGGVAGNVVSYLISPNPSLGASTAIFGLVTAEAVFIFRNRYLYGSRSRSLLINLVLIIGVNLMLGLSPMIDNWGHIGGLLGGLAFGWFAGPLLIPQQQGLGLEYELADQHRMPRAWLTAAVILAVLFGLVLQTLLV